MMETRKSHWVTCSRDRHAAHAMWKTLFLVSRRLSGKTPFGNKSLNLISRRDDGNEREKENEQNPRQSIYFPKSWWLCSGGGFTIMINVYMAHEYIMLVVKSGLEWLLQLIMRVGKFCFITWRALMLPLKINDSGKLLCAIALPANFFFYFFLPADCDWQTHTFLIKETSKAPLSGLYIFLWGEND